MVAGDDLGTQGRRPGPLPVLTARTGPEQAIENPGITAIFALPDSCIGAMTADFRASAVERREESRLGLRCPVALPIPFHQR